MIKIIHFVPSINVTSGIANMIMSYYRKIDRSRIQFDFIYFLEETEGNFISEIEGLGGSTYKVAPPTRFTQFYSAMMKYLKVQDQSRVIFHNHQSSFTVFLKPITNKCGIKNFIVHQHLTKHSDKRLSAIRNGILCLPIKLMNIRCFACSEDAGIFLFGKKKMTNGDVFIMDNGIDSEKFKFSNVDRCEVRKELGLEENYVIGHVGHFVKMKNHEFIVQVFYKYVQINSKARLLLVGDGVLKEKIKCSLQKLGIIDKVIFLEKRKDISRLMSAMDLFIFPSLFEGLGIVAIEAQANGLPILIADTVPNDTHIYNYTVLGINQNADEWAKEINDKSKVTVNRTAGNEYVARSKFDINVQVEKVVKQYEEIIQ